MGYTHTIINTQLMNGSSRAKCVKKTKHGE